MYWDNIINELSKYGTVEIWEDEFMDIVTGLPSILAIGIVSPYYEYQYKIVYDGHTYSFDGDLSSLNLDDWYTKFTLMTPDA